MEKNNGMEIPVGAKMIMDATTDCLDKIIEALQNSEHGEGKTREELLDMALDWAIGIFSAAKENKEFIGFKD